MLCILFLLRNKKGEENEKTTMSVSYNDLHFWILQLQYCGNSFQNRKFEGTSRGTLESLSGGCDRCGGFHGDGETFVKLSCADGFEENLGSDWQALPLEGAAYEYFYNWGGILEDPETEEDLIPEIENGYWYYRDTGPMNWELAIYDCDENILYYYEFDA